MRFFVALFAASLFVGCSNDTIDDTDVARLDDRSVLAVAPGQARLDASLEGRVASATIEVLDASVDEIEVTPSQATTPTSTFSWISAPGSLPRSSPTRSKTPIAPV